MNFLKKIYKKSEKNDKMQRTFVFLYNLIAFNKVKVKKCNEVIYIKAFLKKCQIVINGKDNIIIIEPSAVMKHCKIEIRGNGNVFHIGENSNIQKSEFVIESDHCVFDCGKKTIIGGVYTVLGEKNTNLIIGDNCLLSDGIEILTTDSHSIIDLNTNYRINFAKDVVIGNKVWICNGVVLLKGSGIPDGCVVGRKSIVTKKFSKPNCVIAGFPAKVLQENISWLTENIEKENNSKDVFL